MSLFVISDLHLPLAVDKPMDIFGGWDNYVERIEENWQRLVGPEDTVVLPGDLSWAMKLEQALPDLEFLNSLNGRKIISKGNHDYWWSTVGKMEKFFKENGLETIDILHNNFYAYGDAAICGTRGWISENGEPADKKVVDREAIRLELSLSPAVKQGLKPIVFLHYPPLNYNGVNEPIMNVLKRFDIKECFYGHIHGRQKHSYAVKGEVDGINYHLVSSDYLQFIPLDISEIVQINK